MGKLMIRLTKQLTTTLKKDAEDCIEIYNYLKDTDKDGCVWSSRWTPLVDVTFKGYPSSERSYKPTNTGHMFLKGIRK
jgi:hypothetical protein